MPKLSSSRDFASSCPHPGCSMEGCNARHHKLLHGNSNPAKKTQCEVGGSSSDPSEGMGGPTTASVQTNLDNKTIPLQVPISECIYENSAENYKCSPNDPGKETRFPLPLLPVAVVPIQTKKGVVHLRA